MENTLSHHGIKGQKWGVRRYQNEDGSLTEEGKKRYSEITRIGKHGGVIKKGTSLYRVTMTPDEKYGPKDKLYVSTNKFDNAMWEDFFSVYKGEKNYSVRLTAIRDIKVAPQYEIGKAYVEVLKAHKFRTKFNTYDIRSMVDSPVFSRKNTDITQNQINGGLNISTDSPTGKRIVKILQDKGYTAVSDVLGRDTSNDPLILFEPYKDVKVSQIRYSHTTSKQDSSTHTIRSSKNNFWFNENYRHAGH